MANDIYIFRPIYEDELYFYLETDGMEFPIEKDICRDIIKPNILRTEEEIPDIIEKVIFPYDKNNKILIEAIFMSKFPQAYKYLSLHKMKLAQRDKGEKNMRHGMLLDARKLLVIVDLNCFFLIWPIIRILCIPIMKICSFIADMLYLAIKRRIF